MEFLKKLNVKKITKIKKVDFSHVDAKMSDWLRDQAKIQYNDIKACYRMAKRNDFDQLAAGFSFFCIFSVFPFLIFSFSILRLFVGDTQRLLSSMTQFLETAVPNIAPWITKSLIKLMSSGSFSSLLGVLILAWSTYGLFESMKYVFEKISVRKGDRDFFGSHVICVLSFILMSASMLYSLVMMTTPAQTVQAFFSSMGIEMGLGVVWFLSLATPIAVFLASLTLIFKYMPTQTIQSRYAFMGAAMFVLIFIAGRSLYSMYLKIESGDIHQMYGVFSTLIFVLIWIHFLSSSFVFSAQYAIYLQEKNRRLS